ESISSTSAPTTGMPPALTIGSVGSNWVSGSVTAPVSVRSSSTPCDVAFTLSTEWMTSDGVVSASVTLPMSHPASAMASAAAPSAASTAARDRPSSEANRDTDRRQERELRDGLACRRSLGVVEHVQKHVLRVVGVHDAEIGRDGRSADAVAPRHVDVEPLCGREARAIPRPADEFFLRPCAARPEGVELRIVEPADDLADDVGIRSARGVAQSYAEQVLGEPPTGHDVEVVPPVVPRKVDEAVLLPSRDRVGIGDPAAESPGLELAEQQVGAVRLAAHGKEFVADGIRVVLGIGLDQMAVALVEALRPHVPRRREPALGADDVVPRRRYRSSRVARHPEVE